jgi:hypothetical protein
MNSPNIKELAQKIKLYIKANEKVYPILKKICDKKGENKICKQEDQFCIEGYPSSGNSFGYNFLKVLFPNLNICHHSHSVANIKRSLQYDIPTTVFIREPDECISSRCVRFGDGRRKDVLRRAAREYVWFYKYVLKIQKNVSILPFNTLVERPRVLADQVTETAYPDTTPRTKNEVALASEYAQKVIREWSERRVNHKEAHRTMSVPTKRRSQLKKRLQSDLDAIDEIEQAKELYICITKN